MVFIDPVFFSGDFLQRWTNDHWISPVHRVVGQPSLDTADILDTKVVDKKIPKLAEINLSRKSIVFFSGPVKDVLIDTIVTVGLNGENLTPKYEPIKAGDHLKMKLSQTQVHND